MSDPIPWAIDDLIISDNHDWRSSFLDAFGLASVSVVQSTRTNRWPLLGGVSRAQRKLTLRTLFGQRAFADREAARLLLMQNLNYETEMTRRLVASDWPIYDAAPTHVLLACGPMDVYRDAGTWYVRDLLQRYAGTLGGGWWTEPDSGIQIAEAATNKVLNPSAGAAGNFAAKGAATVTASTDYAYRGGKSFKVVMTAAVGDGMTMTMSALGNAIHTMTVRVYDECSTLQFSLNNADWSTPVLLGTDGDWSVYGWQFPALQANTSTTLYIQQSAAIARTLYIDCVQVEQTSYPTPYVDGAGGQNHSWSGAAHASTSSRTAATLKFANILSSEQGTLALTWTPIADNTAATRYLFSEGNLKAYFNSTDDKITFTDGTNTITTSALTFNGMTAQRLAFTWSLNGLKIYRNGALAASGATYTAPTLGTYLYIGSTTASVTQASGWIDDLVVFDTEASASTIFFLGDGTTLGRARWIDVMCDSVQAVDARDYGLVTTLNIDDDIRWRSRDGDAAFWRVYDDTGNCNLANLGDDDTYPIFYLTTKTAKTAGVAYSRYVFLVWKATSSATRYPVRITLPDLTGKAQADGDDIRVIVDSNEIDRWLDGTITGYNVWVNLNFSAAPSAVTLASQMLIGATVTSITCACDVSDWPSTGTILIDSEAFTYTGRVNTRGSHVRGVHEFTGVTRAAKGTAAATHAAATPIYLVQRDIVITYGDATLTAPTVDANYKPAFELATSTNTSWVYAMFGDDAGKRAGAWAFVCSEGVATKTTADHGTTATPWTDIGVVATAKRHGTGDWRLYNPCGLTNINVTNGEYYGQLHLNDPEIEIYSSVNGGGWTHNYILTPTCDATWRAWSQNVALSTGAKFVRVEVEINGYSCGYGSNQLSGEFADATVTVNSSYTPAITIGSETSSGATFAPVITNATTGESITLNAALGVNMTLTVDTANKTITLGDGSSRLDILALDSTRTEWLRLVAGVNQLTFSDVGTEYLEIDVEWTRRYFE